jgi:hypothetical protein
VRGHDAMTTVCNHAFDCHVIDFKSPHNTEVSCVESALFFHAQIWTVAKRTTFGQILNSTVAIDQNHRILDSRCTSMWKNNSVCAFGRIAINCRIKI